MRQLIRHVYDSVMQGIIALVLLIFSVSVQADQADVSNVEVTSHGDRRYSFKVTVQHADTGWEHYADAMVIYTEDDKYLFSGNLRHPHVKEQPFIRSLPNVPVPEDIDTVIIRAHCSRDGFGGAEITIKLPEESSKKK